MYERIALPRGKAWQGGYHPVQKYGAAWSWSQCARPAVATTLQTIGSASQALCRDSKGFVLRPPKLSEITPQPADAGESRGAAPSGTMPWDLPSGDGAVAQPA